MSSNDLFKLEPEVLQQLARFTQFHPKRLHHCAQISPRIAQLAISFPLLFVTLANPLVAYEQRQKIVRSTVDGAPLKEIASGLGVPFCLRNLPPEACPKHYRPHHWSAASSRNLRSLIPHDPLVAALWLNAITFAARFGDECIALWVARHHALFVPHRFHVNTLHPLVLFAWFSRHHPQLVGPCELWTPNLQLRNATERCFNWLTYLKVAADLGPEGLDDPWIEEAREGDLHIVPLTTPHALKDEAWVMDNCLTGYSGALVRNECRVFSVRVRHHRVATMEVRRSTKDSKLYVHELLGARNVKCPLGLWQRTIDFVAMRQGTMRDQIQQGATGRHFQKLLQPYVRAMDQSEHRQLSRLTMQSLEAGLQHILWLAPWKRR